MGSLLFPARTQKDKGAKSNSKSCKGMWTEMLPSSSFAEQGPGAKKLKHLKTQKMNGGKTGEITLLSPKHHYLGGWKGPSQILGGLYDLNIQWYFATHGFIIVSWYMSATRHSSVPWIHHSWNLENGSKTKVSFFLNLDLYHGHSGKWSRKIIGMEIWLQIRGFETKTPEL